MAVTMPLKEGRRAVAEAGEREVRIVAVTTRTSPSPGRPLSGAHLQSVSSMDNTVAVIASPEDALTEWDTVDAAALGERTWLPRTEGSGTRACNEAFLARHEISPPTLTLVSNGAINEPPPAVSGSRRSAAPESRPGTGGSLSLRSWARRTSSRGVAGSAGPRKTSSSPPRAIIRR